jgi:hypothetical protein
VILAGRPPALLICVAPGCAGCDTAVAMAAAVRQVRPHREVVVIDLADGPASLPSGVIGTPTYLLDDEVVSLGTPTLAELLRVLDSSDAPGQDEGLP